jgi:hypothetical protein
MANRIVLNNISYHGSGAIAEIPGMSWPQSADVKKRSSAPTPIS